MNQPYLKYWYFAYPFEPRRPKGAKWAPPWMTGDLAQPNAAKISIPHAPCHGMRSDGIVAGEIIAWRAWYWTGKRLRSLFVDYEWPVDAPALGIPVMGYGIHGFNSKRRVESEYFVCKEDVIFGQVALWGDVVEYQGGYCAEYGRVYKLFDNKYSKVNIDKVRKLYGVGDEEDA